MASWQCFQKDDAIEIVAPASSVPPEHVEGACEILRSWGLKPQVHADLFNGHPYLAHEDKQRLRSFQKALKSSSRGIWCVRGGYGALRLTAELAKMAKPSRPKLLIGYSDISSLHLLVQQKFKWVSCHGPLLESLFLKKYSEEDLFLLRQTLFGEVTELAAPLDPLNKVAKARKIFSGELMGGNLMTFASHFGTPLTPRMAGKILFFEETGERGYRVDRLFTQILQQKEFRDVRAVVLGDFLGGDEKSGTNFVTDALGLVGEHLDAMKIPLFAGLPVGHGSRNRAVFCGQTARIENGTFLQKTGVVR